MTKSRRVSLMVSLGTLLLGASELWAQDVETSDANGVLAEPPPIPSVRGGYTLRGLSASNATLQDLSAVASSFSISPSTRSTARAFYQKYYLASQNIDIGWTGRLSGVPGQRASGDAGTTSTYYQSATLLRINWFRAMAGIPATVVLNNDYSADDQQAAIMMAANETLSHSPTNDWLLYNSDGATAAQNSNLALGWSGPDAITAYMLDYGATNEAIGHRRWLLYPQTKTMGTGDIPWVGDFYSANAVWVLDGNYGTTRPATRDGFVAWPPPGYVPSTTIFPRWSFSYPDADFSTATVSMTTNGVAVPTALEPLHNPSYGENTLVWVWRGFDADTVHKPMAAPSRDTPFVVQVKNVKIGGKARNFTYTVTAFNPGAGDPIVLPDLSIANWGKTDWVGQNIYETSPGTQQFSGQVKAGGWGHKFKLKVQNDGNQLDTLFVQATSANGLTFRYFDGAANVTNDVLAGNYKVSLKAGLARALMVIVTAPAGTVSGTRAQVTITTRSTNNTAKLDAVGLTVSVP